MVHPRVVIAYRLGSLFGLQLLGFGFPGDLSFLFGGGSFMMVYRGHYITNPNNALFFSGNPSKLP